MALNPYINSFDTQADFEDYLDGSTAKAPNVAYIRATDMMKYTKAVPNPTWIIYGTTTGTEDFYIGSSGSYTTSSASNGIHIHVQDGIFYATVEDVVGDIKYFRSNYSGFFNAEGKKITKLKRWAYQNTDIEAMEGMFSYCTSITTIDMSNLDARNVTSMATMFQDCGNLTSVNMSNCNTSSVTNLNSMFNNCSGLTSVDLSDFDTSNATNMGGMFWKCQKITTIDLSSFDTAKLTNMSNMFYQCNAVNKLILGPGFFNSTSLSTFEFSNLEVWRDADSLETFVQAAEVHDGTGKTIRLSGNTKYALTQGQRDRLTGAGWTI